MGGVYFNILDNLWCYRIFKITFFKFVFISYLWVIADIQRGYNGEEIKGYTSLQTGASYINFKNITNMKELVNIITHEIQRSMDIQAHRDIN